MFQFDVMITVNLLKEVHTHGVDASKTYNFSVYWAQTQTQLTHNLKLHCLGVTVADFEGTEQFTTCNPLNLNEHSSGKSAYVHIKHKVESSYSSRLSAHTKCL